MEKNIELSLLLMYYGAFITPRQQKLMKLHVDEDLSLSEIAQQEGISRQGVHDTLKRAKLQLFEAEAKLGLVKRTLAVREGLDALEKGILAVDIEEPKKQKLLLLVKALKEIWEV